MKQQPRLGFTIVELLIVIVVIGILAAITFVAYSGIQDRANQAAVQSDLANIKKKLEIYKLTEGTYPYTATTTGNQILPQLQTIDIKLSTGSYRANTESSNLLYVAERDGSEFILLATPKNSSTLYISSMVGGVRDYTEDTDCSFPGGSSSIHAACLGLTTNSTSYYIYTPPAGSAGGFRVWG